MAAIAIKRAKTPKCECGKLAVDGSVFCCSCRAEIKRKNAKILSRDKELFNLFIRKS